MKLRSFDYIFRRFFLFMGMISFGVTKISAQNIYPNDSQITPKIFLNDEKIEWENFPACSKDGKIILLIHSEYSCCILTQVELQILQATTSSVLQKILLIPEESTSDFPTLQKKMIIAYVDSILRKQNYDPLIPLDTFTVEKNDLNSKNNVNFTWKNVKLKSNDFELPEMQQQGYCCSGIQDDINPCSHQANIYKIWINAERQFLLIEYGLLHPADGCDVGPEYLIVTIHKRKLIKAK
jgi:hypothetical protein